MYGARGEWCGCGVKVGWMRSIGPLTATPLSEDSGGGGGGVGVTPSARTGFTVHFAHPRAIAQSLAPRARGCFCWSYQTSSFVAVT